MLKVIRYKECIVAGRGHSFKGFIPSLARVARWSQDKLAFRDTHIKLITKTTLFNDRTGNSNSL